MKIKVISGPHVKKQNPVRRIMLQVIMAILPATLFGIYLFGWPAFNLFVVTICSALFFEYLCLRLAGKPSDALSDGSALLSAWLLAMTLPPWAPWWIGVVGSAIAIILGKQVYGGLGQNVFNPAMLARVALLISFPVEMTTWANTAPLFSTGAPDFVTGLSITFVGLPQLDAYTGASVLGHVKTELTLSHELPGILAGVYEPVSAWFGLMRGSLGETSTVLLLLGGLWLLFKGVISWHVPFAMLFSVMVISAIFHWWDPAHYLSPWVHLNSGALMCAAFFIATDYVTSPNSASGQLLFAACCGALVYVIRTWGGYPEGVAFAVLLMNAATPLMDHYLKPRIYGRTRKGTPLEGKES